MSSPSLLHSRPLLVALLTGFAVQWMPAQTPQTRNGSVEAHLPQSEVDELKEEGAAADQVSAAYVREQVESLDRTKPLYRRTHACFLRLLDEGENPALLNECLDALGDDAIIVGMPADLVTAYFGEPKSQQEVIRNGAPAEVWNIQTHPGRMEKVTVANGTVVQIQD